jgi:hypothetical protein
MVLNITKAFGFPRRWEFALSLKFLTQDFAGLIKFETLLFYYGAAFAPINMRGALKLVIGRSGLARAILLRFN